MKHQLPEMQTSSMILEKRIILLRRNLALKRFTASDNGGYQRMTRESWVDLNVTPNYAEESQKVLTEKIHARLKVKPAFFF